MSVMPLLRPCVTALGLLLLGGCLGDLPPAPPGPDLAIPDAGPVVPELPVNEDTLVHTLPLAQGDTLRQLLVVDDGFGLLFTRSPDEAGVHAVLYQALERDFSARGPALALGTCSEPRVGLLHATSRAGSEVLAFLPASDTQSTPQVQRLLHGAAGAQRVAAPLALAIPRDARPVGIALLPTAGHFVIAWLEGGWPTPHAAVLDLSGAVLAGPLELAMQVEGDDEGRFLRFEHSRLAASGEGFAFGSAVYVEPEPGLPGGYDLRLREFDARGAALGPLVHKLFENQSAGAVTYDVSLAASPSRSPLFTWSNYEQLAGSASFSVETFGHPAFLKLILASVNEYQGSWPGFGGYASTPLPEGRSAFVHAVGRATGTRELFVHYREANLLAPVALPRSLLKGMSSVLRDGLHFVPGRSRPLVVAFDKAGTWQVAETVLPTPP